MSPLVDFEEWEAEQLRDPAFVAALAERDPAYQVTRLRILHGLTQAQLAELTGTKPASIARLERGTPPPNLSFLRKVAAALGARVEVKLVPTETRTWELCGSLEVAEPEPEYVVRRDEQGRPITNYAEHADELPYPQVPAPLRKQAHAVAKLRGETLSDVVRLALKEYVQEALDDARDHRELNALVARIDAGLESLHDHDDVWARIEALEAQGALPD